MASTVQMYKLDDVNVVGQLYLPSLSAFTYITFKIAHTVKPVLVATSIKQATCIKRPVFRFPVMTYKYNFTCIKQAPGLSKHFLAIP